DREQRFGVGVALEIDPEEVPEHAAEHRARRRRRQELLGDGLELRTLVRVGERAQALEELVVLDALATVERVDQETLARARRHAHEEMAGESDAFERYADARADFH